MAARGPEREPRRRQGRRGASRRFRGEGEPVPSTGRQGPCRGGRGYAARAPERGSAVRGGPGLRGGRAAGGPRCGPRGRRRASRARGRFGARIRHGGPAARRSGGRWRGKQDASGPVLVVGRIEVEDPVRGEEARHPKPHEVARPLAPEVERHHLGPHHGIGRRPGLGLEPENEEFGRQRTRPPLHPCVDPVDVGVDPAPCAGGEVGQGGLRPVVESEHPQQAIGGEGGCAQHLGEASPRRSAGSSPSAIAGPRRGRSRGRRGHPPRFGRARAGRRAGRALLPPVRRGRTRPARRPSRGATPGATGSRPPPPRRSARGGRAPPSPPVSETRPCQLVAHAVSILHPSVHPSVRPSARRRPRDRAPAGGS